MAVENDGENKVLLNFVLNSCNPWKHITAR